MTALMQQSDLLQAEGPGGKRRRVEPLEVLPCSPSPPAPSTDPRPRRGIRLVDITTLQEPTVVLRLQGQK
jgi:hypothetical protein